MPKPTDRQDVYTEITGQIVAALETGVKPWSRPWEPGKAAGPMAPVNATTGKYYRGINTLLLGMHLLAFMSNDPRWCGFEQAKSRGWSVKKGSKGTRIYFFSMVETEDKETGEKKDRPILKGHTVFHASQIEGIPAYKPPTVEEAPWREPEAAAIIVRNSRAVVRIGGGSAFYSPSTDHIQMPPNDAFKGPPEWSATMLHELSHWTGATHRLNRELSKAMRGSHEYAREELRAELASVFVASHLDIPADVPNHASYIKSWTKALKDDKREIFRAAAEAQRMADYVLGFHPDFTLKMAAQAERPAIEQDNARIAPRGRVVAGPGL